MTSTGKSICVCVCACMQCMQCMSPCLRACERNLDANATRGSIDALTGVPFTFWFAMGFPSYAGHWTDRDRGIASYYS